jgi:hypothetical protein
LTARPGTGILGAIWQGPIDMPQRWRQRPPGSNWGDFGPDDQRGRMNFVTPSSDIFGFGAKLREDNIQEWDLVRNDWQEVFKNLEVNVITMMHIRNSSMLSKPLEKGE